MFRISLATMVLLLLPGLALAGDDVARLLEDIRSVGPEGAGNARAGTAWRELVRAGPASLPKILSGMDGANRAGANWLRTAVDAIAEKTLQAHGQLPAAQLEEFVQDRKHSGAARRLAYEWLSKIEPGTPGRLLPGMLDDPSLELRRDAVVVVVDEAARLAGKGDKERAKKTYQKALSGARDRDQVETIAKELLKLGVKVDLVAHFNLINNWFLLGPFDSKDGTGFARLIAPEIGVDLDAGYTGKKNVTLRWLKYTTSDPQGVVDLNKALGKHMAAVAYAYAWVASPREQPIEVRAASNNAVKIFLNGKQICFCEEYHHGMYLDQYVGTGVLREGKNELLIKVCQNEQTEDWAQNWSFQARICDALGGPVPMRIVSN